MARDDRVSRSAGPITELNNNTETFASTCLKVHRFSVYKFPPRGVETVNRIYIRGGGIPSRKDPAEEAYTRKDKRKKVDGNNRGPDIARDVSRYCSSIVRTSFIIFVSATTTREGGEGPATQRCPFRAGVKRRLLRGKKKRKKERNWFPKVN